MISLRNIPARTRSFLLNPSSVWNSSKHLFQNAITQNPIKLAAASIHSTAPRNDLMEFFDDKKNWGKNEVRVGRAWRIQELRIKSNSDLHKLWYVLLKERNMLKTMEHEAAERYELFPNPERIDKVQMSMDNIEKVVRERNQAYHLLETGVDGERPARMERDIIGMKFLYQAKEYFTPKEYNRSWDVQFFDKYRQDRDVRTFLNFYREKFNLKYLKARAAQTRYVTKLLRRFPNVDRGLLNKKYPNVDVRAIDFKDKARGHNVPKID